MSADNFSDKLICDLRKLESQNKLSLLTEYTVESSLSDKHVYMLSDNDGAKFVLKAVETTPEKAEDCTSDISLLNFIKTNSVVRLKQWEYAKLSKKRGYLLMVYDAGSPVEAPLSAEEAVRLGVEISSALEECHMGGILHLNIKPSNILLFDDGAYKISDFGKVYLDPHPNEYSAPEYRSAGDFDHRADIYSLSLSIYTLMGGSPEDAEDLKPLDSCPKKLLDVLKKACSADPEERYSFMRPFGIALEKSLSAEPEEAEDIKESVDEAETSEPDTADDEPYEGNDGEDCFADRAQYEESDREKPDLDGLFDGEDDEDEEGAEAETSSESDNNSSDDDRPALWDTVKCSKARAAADIIIMIIAALALLAVPALVKFLSC